MRILRTEDASWRPLYEALRRQERGTLLTYETLDGMMVPPGDIRQNRWPLYRADRELRIVDMMALRNVPSVGYRIALAEEHLGIANTHRKRGRRQAHKAWLAADAADLSQIADPAIRQALTDLSDHMRAVEARMRSVESRADKTEAALRAEADARRSTQLTVEARLARLEELLAESRGAAEHKD